jgi:glyoxylase-like metal-dependent hydrolase (beta-lactamase superfamily II)
VKTSTAQFLAQFIEPIWRKLIKLILLYILFGTSIGSAAVGDVGVYTSPLKSFSTASYWIEGAQGLILIDTQFLPKEGLQAVELAEKSTGKKVVTALILHPNPDKFNGTRLMQERGIKVITSAQVAALIPAVHNIRWGWFGEEFAPDYPREAAKPEVFGDRSFELNVEGLVIKLHVLGKGASGAHVVAQYQSMVFVGDLINPDNHAWLELGFIGDWLSRLDDIRAMKPLKIYPGRGVIGGIELVESQATYLKLVRKSVREVLASGELGWFRKQLLQRKIEAAYPNLGYALFMRDGLPAVWINEQATKQ